MIAKETQKQGVSFMNMTARLSGTSTSFFPIMRSGVPSNSQSYNILAWCANANLSNEKLIQWLREQKLKVPEPVLLAWFEEGTFTNSRLEAMLNLGFHSWIMGEPSRALIEKICTRVTKGTLCFSNKYGCLLLQNNFLYQGENQVRLTVTEASLLHMLMIAGSEPVRLIDMQVAHGYRAGSKTHTFATHIYRLREKLKQIGMATVIARYGRSTGYYLDL